MANGIATLADYRDYVRREFFQPTTRDAKAIYLQRVRSTFQSRKENWLDRRRQFFGDPAEGTWKGRAQAIRAEMFGNVRAINRIERVQHAHQSFVDRAIRLDLRGHTDSALDLLYDSVDELLRADELSQLDALLAELRVVTISADMLLGLLTATLPARSRLPARARMFREVEQVLRQRGELELGLLTGLE